MVRLLAQFISFLFHPILFLLLIPFLAEYKHTYSGIAALKWEVFTALFIFFGLIAFLLGRWHGIFSDFDLSKREERGKFYGLAGLLAATYLAVSLSFKGLVFPLSIVAVGILIGIVVFVAVNRIIKASIHVAIASAFVIGVSYSLNAISLLSVLWIVPAVAWSRLYLKKHTIREVVIGGFLGTAITAFTLLFGRYIMIGKLW